MRRRQAETRTPGAPGAAEASAASTAGPMEGESGSVRLDELDGTFEEAGFDSRTHGRGGGWRINRRRVSTLPDRDDPRETQVAVGLFGDDGGEGGESDGQKGGQDGGEEEISPQQRLQDGETEAEETDTEDTTRTEREDTALDAIKFLPNAAAEELSRIQRELAERTDLSEEEIEAYGRDILKLTPGLGEVLSAEDAVDALRAAREALVNKDFQAALSSTAEGLVELGGAIPLLGKFVRGGKIGLRVARDLAERLRRTSLGRGLRQRANRDDKRPEGQLPSGSVAKLDTPNGVKASVDTFEAMPRHIERLHKAAADVGTRHVEAVSGLLDGGRLNTRAKSGKDIVNIDHLGGRVEAEAAFGRAIEEAGGKLLDVRPWPRGGVV